MVIFSEVRPPVKWPALADSDGLAEAAVVTLDFSGQVRDLARNSNDKKPLTEDVKLSIDHS